MISESRMDIRRPLLKRLAGPFLCVFILFYLGFHAVSGERGLFALATESRRLERLQSELTDITTKRQMLEHKVKLMGNNSLDLDMLDEQVHIVLGMADKNEVVYFLDDNGQAAEK